MRCLVLIFAAVVASALPAFAQRETSDLLTGWKFIRQDVALDAPVTGWQGVTVPHTWNNFDGEDGMAEEPELKYGYYRGVCWYERTLDAPPAWKAKRVFIRFEAASTVAQVYLNGQLLGEHRGGFTAFCFELTKYLRFDAPNDLRVRVDNSPFDDVAPLSGDFNIDGGIYRPVHLIVTDPVCISPLDHGSCGVYITPKVTPNYHEPPTASELDFGGEVDAKVVFSNGSPAAISGRVTITVNDASGSWVERADYPEFVELKPGETKDFTFLEGIGHKVHEWNGRLDPYLYHITIHISANGSDDEVTQSFGFRDVAISNEKGFLLNGRPYPIHGVNYHQDRRDEGWALTQADREQDMKLMLDMGVTAIRLAHYPQSEEVHDLADRNGILLWNEIPMVNAVHDTPEFRANAAQQQQEMILQRYNHPSAAFWGLYNEMDVKLDDMAVPVLRDLKASQTQLDPSRLSVAASCFSKAGFNALPDWICFNPYFGWYNGQPDELAAYIDARYRDNGDKRIGLSEYGAGANPRQHAEEPLSKPKAGGQFHPEEWQAHVHEVLWGQIKDNPKLWGTFLWCMFDFASDHRNEGGQPGLNDKGMVTADRKVLKDAYYFYQANWTDVPMVHITGHRFVDRHEAVTPVKVYSNAAQVELKVNGQSLGVRTPDPVHVCVWPEVHLQPGANAIEASVPGTALTDKCGWVYTARSWWWF